MKIASIIKELSGGKTVTFFVEDPLKPEDAQGLSHGMLKMTLAASFLTCEIVGDATMDQITPSTIQALNEKFAAIAQGRIEKDREANLAILENEVALKRLSSRTNLPLV